MAGQGSQSKLGIRKETTGGTPLVPTRAFAFASADFSAPRTLIESQTIGGTGMVQDVVPGDPESSGTITQEYDGEQGGEFIWMATGDNGYTAGGAFTDGQITTAPGATAGSTGASIAAGDYYYTVAAVWTHDFLGTNFIMPDSAASTQTTVASGEEVALTWTDPTGLTLADHTYAGTAIYRSTTDGASSTVYFIHYVSGTGASYTDTGADTYADTAVTPVANTTLYDHLLEGAAAASSQDRLDYFTVQMSKNVGSDEQFNGNKVSELTIDVGGRGDVVTLSASFIGSDMATVSGEFSASAPTIRQQTLGRDVRVAIDGSVDCDFQSISLTVNNNLERQPTLCDAVTIGEGNRTVSGSATLIFNDRTIFNKAVNADSITLGIYMKGEPLTKTGATLSAGSHNIAAIPFPRLSKFYMADVKIGSYTNPVDGPGQIIANIEFQALEDSTTSTDLAVTIINTTSSYTGA